MAEKIDYRNSPVAWFVEMQLHAEKGNFEKAAMAKRELERLGVFIRFKGSVQRKYTKAEATLKKISHLVTSQKPTVLGSGNEQE